MSGSNNPNRQKENVRYYFAWSKSDPYVWLTPVTFTVRGVVHLWEALRPGHSCKVFPMTDWNHCPMDSRLVDIGGRNVFITLRPKSSSEVDVQTDMRECVAISELEFIALLNEAIINVISCINEQQGKR